MRSLFDQPEDWQPPVRESVPVVAWMDSAQAGLLGVLSRMAGLRVVGVAGPWQSRGSGQEEPDLASLDCPAIEEFPKAVTASGAKLVLVLSGASLDGGQACVADDAELRERVAETGALVLSLPPVMKPTPSERPMRAGGGAYQIPLFVRSPMMDDLREVLATMGSVRSLVAHFRGLPEHGPVSGRFFDAMALAHALFGEPEQVDAAAVRAGGGHAGTVLARGHSAAAFEELRGDLLCTLRYTGGHAASIAASDHGGRWSRGFTIVADGGVIRATDRGFEVTDHQGKTIDSGDASGRQANTSGAGRGVHADAVAVMASALVRLTDARLSGSEVFDAEAVLASCRAAALSARTGQGESPATMRHMQGN